MKELIMENLGGKKILLFFIVTNIVYAFMLFVTIPHVMVYSGGKALFDMMPFRYDVAYANSLMGALGIAGRDEYLFKQIPVDTVYPFLFGVTYCLVLAYFLNKIGKLQGWYFYLCYIPILAGLFDYAENFGIIMMLKTYPDNPNMLTYITSDFSVLKSSFTAIYSVVLAMVLSVFVIGKLRGSIS